MTRSEMMQHLDINKFEPFRIRMNNGEAYDVKHPENARLTVSDSLYIFRPVESEAGVVELVTIARIHNICTIEKPIDSAA